MSGFYKKGRIVRFANLIRTCISVSKHGVNGLLLSVAGTSALCQPRANRRDVSEVLPSLSWTGACLWHELKPK